MLIGLQNKYKLGSSRVPSQTYYKTSDPRVLSPSIVKSAVKEILFLAQKELDRTIGELAVLDIGSGYGEYSFEIEKYVKKQYETNLKESKESPFLSGMLGNPSPIAKKTSAYYRSKHRMRMITLYFHGELLNYLILGTCNKTEISVGFFVKHGDSASDFDPLENLYKTQVRQLAQHLGVTQKIITKAPTPDLLPGITDEFAMGISYETLDLVLFGMENKMANPKIAKQLGIKEEIVDYVQELTCRSQHMRSTGH